MGGSVVKIGVIGFGTVGAGTVKVLWERQSDIEKVLGVRIQVARVIDKDWVRERPVVVPPELRGEDPALVLEDPEIQIVVEAIGGVSPAFEIVSEALSRGKSVVTPNKELIAKRGGELLEIATKQGVDLFFEGAVGGGIPIIHALKEQLAGDDIEEVIGIVNGTTNFILSAMSLQRAPYEEALREAQRRGFAEPIPTMDVEGFDAAYKLAILASLCFHTKVDVDSVFREGITRLIPEDLEFARELGFVVKLLAISKKTNGRLELRVHPVLLPEEHPLASVTGVENAIYVKSKTRALTFRGPGAGGEATGSALVGDIIEAIRNLKYNCRGRVGCTCLRELSVRPVEELVTQYCVRILALDVPGVLGKIATQFGEAGVSLSAVKQPVSTPGKLTNIYFLTHEVQEARLRDSLERIQRLEVVKDVYAIRVERGIREVEQEEIVTSFVCLSCQRETMHRVLYQGGIVRSIICQECGLEVGLDRAKLVALYGEQLIERILTKPQRLTEEYRRDLFEFFSTIPFRIITKPYRMLKEFESLCGD